MATFLSRTEKLVGEEAVRRLSKAQVLVAGVGGVGSFVAEALARGGIGELTLIDDDIVDVTNINRQLQAFPDTVGRPKVEVMQERLLRINPALKCHAERVHITEDWTLARGVTYIADCVDDVQAKKQLIITAQKAHIPVISSMGSGNQVDNRHFTITDLSKTHTCPLARALRKALRQESICKGVKVCYNPISPYVKATGSPGTMSYVPGTAGLLIAGEIIREIIGISV
ncbi:ThiF family adenylyltransferase [Peptococcus simiae]|uniref:tRNA threonylcarbamoyladenosine dehydratase n=1 Tax=Peptococcus simiae TaxID=1643805 RepID=UPI00397EC327